MVARVDLDLDLDLAIASPPLGCVYPKSPLTGSPVKPSPVGLLALTYRGTSPKR